MIFMAGGNAYSLVHEYKNGWNPEVFRERYSEVLERFDYIVGDWGYNQLRLRGFYREGHSRATREFAISSFVDYINEYCNFGCAHFVVAKLDINALPPDAVISKEESPEAKVALNEAGEQAAETAATVAAVAPHNGPILRWPLKERAGGPVRVPNVTVSAVARAAAEAEKRNANAHHDGHSKGASGRGGYSKHESGGSSHRQGRSSSSGDRRPQSQQGQGGGQASNKPQHRGQRSHGQQQNPRQERQEHPSVHRAAEEGKPSDSGSVQARNEGARSEGSRQDNNRWQGRNRRRKSYGGKPTNRNEGGPHPDAGNTKSSE
jgi:uncharacterized protein YutD